MTPPIGSARSGILGSIVADGVPDSAIAHYDATAFNLSDGETVGSWPDQEGSFDLSSVGGAVYKTDVYNGNAVVRYDGTDDGHVNTAISASQPFAVVAVTQRSGGAYVYDSPNGDRTIMTLDNPDAAPGINAGSWLSGGSANSNLRLIAGIWDGSNSEVRAEGSSVATGDPGTATLDEIEVAAPNAGQILDGDIGEIVVLDNPDSGDVSSEEQRLADKWGFSL